MYGELRRWIPAILVLLSACAKQGREPERAVTQKSLVAADGTIQLTTKEVQANGLQTVAAVEQEVASALFVFGRAAARPGAEARLFAPFAGRLIGDPARIPRPGMRVARGQTLCEVEQLLPVTDRTQFAAQAVRLDSEITQARAEAEYRRRELERNRQLYEGGAIALKQLQAAELALHQAEANVDGLESARTQYESALSTQDRARRRFPIFAPFSGTGFGRDLVVRGAMERLSPILMTALTAGLGLLPLALSAGKPGRELEQPMALVILGGLLTSTLLNLVVLPALYLRFGRPTRHDQPSERTSHDV